MEWNTTGDPYMTRGFFEVTQKVPQIYSFTLLKYALHDDSHNTNCKAIMAFAHPDVLSMGASSPHCSQARLGFSCSPFPLPGIRLSEFTFTIASTTIGFLQLLSRSFYFISQMLTCQNGLPWLSYLEYSPTILLLLLQHTYQHLAQHLLFLFLLVVFLQCQNVSTTKPGNLFSEVQQHPEKCLVYHMCLTFVRKKV